jgi:hypothetical protein
MIKTIARVAVVFTLLLVSNNLAGGQTAKFDGPPTPQCPNCLPPSL